jgi:tRNA G18 (ribose-2'-O)-methylase SpoU
MIHYETWEDWDRAQPFAWVPVGVEQTLTIVGIETSPTATDLRDYKHPANAVYILGSEASGLTNEAMVRCRDLVVIPSRYCLNVAVAGSVVLYDRIAKGKRA